MATDINIIYPAATRLVPQVQHALQLLQDGVPQGEALDGLLHDVSRDINQLKHHVKQLDAATGRQAAHRRDLWKSRIQTLSSKTESLRRELELLLSRKYRRAKEEADRHALLSGANSVVIDCAIKESESIARSHGMLDDMMEVGSNVMGSLVVQKSTLKRAHMKTLEMANMLGLSNSLMRVIQRRTSGDKILVYGGMVLICFLLYFVYRMTRSA